MKKLLSLENFIFITIFWIPLYLVRLVIWGVPTNLFELLALFAVLVFLTGSVGSKIELRDYKKYFAPMVAIILGLFISTFHNDAHRVGFGIIKSWFVVPIIFSWIAVQLVIKKDILNAIYFSALGAACIALGYSFLGNLTFDGRLQAIFNSPNYLAMFLTPAIVIGVAKFAENKKFHAISLLILASVLYLTFSYAAWLALFVSLAILFYKKEEFKISKWNVGLVLAGLTIVFLQIDSNKLQSLIHIDNRSSMSSRLMIWRSAGKMIVDDPIIGIGPGNFQAKYLEYQQYFPPYLEWAVPQPHNIFLAFWLQAGLLGLLGLGWLLTLWFKDLFKRRDSTSIICLAIMVSILVHGLFDTTYFKNDLSVVFWLSFFLGIKNRSDFSER